MHIFIARDRFSGLLSWKDENRRFASIFYSSFLIWLKFGRVHVYKNVLSDFKIQENGRKESLTFRWGLNEFALTFHVRCTILHKFNVKFQQILLFRIREFRKNHHREGWNFLRSVNKITFTRVPWNWMTFWNYIKVSMMNSVH